MRVGQGGGQEAPDGHTTPLVALIVLVFIKGYFTGRKIKSDKKKVQTLEKLGINPKDKSDRI